jgi:hypothetical protein
MGAASASNCQFGVFSVAAEDRHGRPAPAKSQHPSVKALQAREELQDSKTLRPAAK